MLSVKAIYDGKRVKLLEKLNINKPREVIVTFLDEPDTEISADELQLLAEHSGTFNFLNNEQDDIYSDEDLKVRFKKR